MGVGFEPGILLDLVLFADRTNKCGAQILSVYFMGHRRFATI